MTVAAPSNMQMRSYMVTALTALLSLAGCASPIPASHPSTATQQPTVTSRATPTPVRTKPTDSAVAYAVIAGAGHVYALLGGKGPATAPTERLVVSGGWAVDVADLGPSEPSAFTLVSPSAHCVGKATRNVSVRLDLSGYAGARMPSEPARAVEISGCGELARDDAFVIALRGRDPSAHWIHPAHLDDAPAPVDRALGEDEVWLHRWLLPDSDVEVVERTVLRFVTPACSEEQHDTIVVDEGDHPLSQHRDFALRGAIGRRDGPLLVLVGHEDASLRVVEAGASAQVVLDANLDLFADVEEHGC